MTPKLYLIAGHTQGKDEGAQNLRTKETENMIARDLLLKVFPELQNDQIFNLVKREYPGFFGLFVIADRLCAG